jgi:2-hydroxycyclohexanecarboxyl-CoA dehydrogenase
MQLDLQGKVSIVTGGGRGIGEAICRTLADAACAVVVNDVRPDRAEAVCDSVRKAGGKAAPNGSDITRFDQVQELVAAALHNFGRIDILVNNAGLWTAKPFRETTPSDWELDIAVNFYGVLHCTRAVVNQMIEQEYGRIITIVSDAARTGEPNIAAYCGAKAAAIGFTKGLAREVGEFGVTANCIALGSVRTPQSEGDLTEDMIPRILRRYPIKRIGEPQDAANMVLFLASERAEWITGQTFAVNGGYSMIG